MVEEHPDSIDDAAFMFDPGYATGSAKWRNLPASFHGSGTRCNFTFADGHSDAIKWKETSDQNKWTTPPVKYVPLAGNLGCKGSEDYKRVEDMMPYLTP
jgi:prepilin-type processing-associated H-X9-DG protein